ncbi:MAG: TatD family hydrolase [bacterium]|nr:TatD family hydrolase [bacterium]
MAPTLTHMPTYVDVHAHLTHEAFAPDRDEVIRRAADTGLEAVIVNGLEPNSNREVLRLAEQHPHVHAACGIYPVDAIAGHIDRSNWTYDFKPPTPFDVDAEIDWIDAHADRLTAVGECGLDQYWVTDQAEEQERVLSRLCEVAKKHDKPVILHSRKAELRTFEILQDLGVTKADFHCFGGKLKLARRIAEAGYYLSIPPVVERADSFQQMARTLPLDRLLTETDCPYMGPDRNARNEPANVTRGIAAMAAARDIAAEEMATAVRENCRRLFGV